LHDSRKVEFALAFLVGMMWLIFQYAL